MLYQWTVVTTYLGFEMKSDVSNGLWVMTICQCEQIVLVWAIDCGGGCAYKEGSRNTWKLSSYCTTLL